MGRAVRTISVNLQAGTAKFFSDLDASAAKVRQFGGHTVSSMQASSAAIRTLEGNFTNNVRAVERFLTSVLPLGPALQAAFPVVGALALGGVLAEVGSKAYDFWKKIAFGGEEAAGAFRALGAPLRLVNDELLVANDRLQNDIAKLEGHHQNTLKLALDEARVAADKLADSLDKDLANLHKVLDQQNQGFWADLLTGSASTRDLTKQIGGETGFGGFRGQVGQITDEGATQIARATTQKQKDAAQTALNTSLLKAYREELGLVDKAIAQTVDAERIQNEAEYTGGYVDYSRRLQEARAVRRQLAYEMTGISLQSDNAGLTAKKDALTAGRDNRIEDRPFAKWEKEAAASLDALRAKLDAVGKPEAAQVLAKAFGEAQKEIAKLNSEMDRHAGKLSGLQITQIKTTKQSEAQLEVDIEWQSKLAAVNTSIEERIQSQNLLTAAIGRGYDATKAANVETRVMQEMKQKYADPAFASDAANLRGQFGREFEAQHSEQSAQATQKLREQIELERALATAQMQGAEAVRQATLAVKLRQMAIVGATKDELAAEIELYNAQRENAIAGDVSKIMEKVAATERLTAAILGGAAAVRKANLESKLGEIGREGDTAVPGVFGVGARGVAAIGAESADHANELATGAARTNRVQAITEEIAKLTEAKATLGDTLGIEISLRDLENQRIKALAEESLQLRGARDGMRAFFLEMQADAKSAASIVYDALHSAFDQSTANLAKMLTEKRPKGGWGQEWGKEFQGIGESMTQSSIKSVAQKGIGWVGKQFGVDLGSAKPDGTAANPLWVRMANLNGLGGGVPAPSGGAPPLFGGSSGNGIFSLFGKLFHAGASSGNPMSADSLPWGGFMAGGGDVQPGVAYSIEQSGTERFVPSVPGRIVPGGAMGGNHVTVNNNVDARGADLGAHNRIKRGLEMTHKASVAAAVQVMHERARRVPSGR